MHQKIRRSWWVVGWLCFACCLSLFGQDESERPFILRPASTADYPGSAPPGQRPLALPSPTSEDTAESEALTDAFRLDIPYSKKEFAKDLLLDQWAIWQAPFQASKKDLKWMLPLSLTTAALIPLDGRISDSVGDRFEGASLKLSLAGGPASIAAAAGLFGIGHFAKKPHLRETGMLGVRATMDAWLTVKLIKSATNRERPHRNGVEQEGDFWSGGSSFPSGHSAETWALATVIAKQYSHKPWIRFGAYAFAAGISVSRVTGQKHFPSDVLIGGVIGHLIGRYVVRSWRKKRQFHAFQQSQLEAASVP